MIDGLKNIRNLFNKTDANIFALDNILYNEINDKDVIILQKLFNERMLEFIEATKNGNPTIIDYTNITKNEENAKMLIIILEYINRIFNLSNYKDFPINFILDNPDFPDKTDHTAIKELLKSESSSIKNKVIKKMYLEFFYNFLIFLSSKANIDKNDDSRAYIFNIYNKENLYFTSHTCFSYIDISFDYKKPPSFEEFYKKLVYTVYYSKIQPTFDIA